MRIIFILAIIVVCCLVSCKPDANPQPTVSLSQLLADYPAIVFEPTLKNLAEKGVSLQQAVNVFVANPTQAHLVAAQQAWYDTRLVWEQSEAFLFGPVATLGLDPAIDAWPVNYVEIDSVLASGNAFTPEYITGLNTSLKGFHPIEYLLFGVGGNRQAAELTPRQLNYLAALTENLAAITAQMHTSWAATGDNFSAQISQAGKPSSQYTTQRDALLEIAQAMAGIVDEVGNAKIAAPFATQDSTLEESPFANNSWVDFRNNIIGAKQVYLCQYQQQGKGLSDWVKMYNTSLNLQIIRKFDAIIDNIGTQSVPFGKAIYTQPASVQSTQNMLNDLNNILESQLIPLIQEKA